eukprot:PhF_6_TR7865/c0_g1_i1/m.11492
MSDRNSNAASIKSTASAASVSLRGRAMHVLTTAVPLFPLLTNLELKLSGRIVWISMIVDCLQILAFAVNPHMKWGETIRDLTKIFYFSHLPFWDNRFTYLSATNFSAFLWASFALVMLVLIGISWVLMFDRDTQNVGKGYVVSRLVFYGMFGPLFIPVLHYFLSYVVCYQGVTWAFPEMTCWTTTHLGYFIPAIIGLVFHAFFTYVRQCFMYDMSMHPTETLPNSKPHNHCVSIYYTWKAITVILYHNLLARNHADWFCIWLFTTSMALAIMYTFKLPFYSELSTRVRVYSLLLLFVTSLLSYLNTRSWQSQLSNSDVDSILVLCLLAPLYAFAGFVVRIRINSQLEGAVRNLKDTEEPYVESQTLFPSNLPNCDLMYPTHKELCADVAEQATEAEEEEKPDAASLLLPYLTAVHTPSDIEVTTRFLFVHYVVTRQLPTMKMLLLATRTYTKGLARYFTNDSQDIIFINLAYMMMVYANRPRTGLGILDRLARMNASLNVLFQSHKLTIRLKQMLSMRDTAYQKICDQARKLHKEALGHMAQFWNKLMSDQVELSQLASMAAMITAKREQSLHHFRRGLVFTQESSFLSKYAQFMEHVMMEPDRAERVREIIRQDIEEKKKSVMRGSRVQASNNEENIVELLDSIHKQNSESESSQMSSLLSVSSHVLVFILFAMICGILGVDIVFFNAHKNVIQSMRSTGQSRMLSQYAGVVLTQLRQLRVNETTEKIQELRSIIRDFQTSFNQITYGSQATTNEEHARYFKLSSALESVPFPTPMKVGTGLWSIGGDMIESLDRVSTIFQNITSNDHKVTEYNILQDVNRAFNNSFSFFDLELDTARSNAMVSVIVLTGFGLLTICILYAVFVFCYARATQSKLLTLSIFTVVPRRYIDRLYNLARDRTQQYDKENDADGIEVGDTDADQVVRDDLTAYDKMNDDNEDAPLGSRASNSVEADKEESSEIDRTDEQRKTWREVMLLAILLSCGMVCVGFAIAAFQVSGPQRQFTERHDFEDHIFNFIRNKAETTKAAQAYVVQGGLENLQAYALAYYSDAFQLKEQTTFTTVHPSVTEAFRKLVVAFEEISVAEWKAIRLAHRARGEPLYTDYNDFLSYDWLSSSIDLLDPEIQTLARSSIFGLDFSRLEQKLSIAADSLLNAFKEYSPYETMANTYFTVVAVLAGVFASVALLALLLRKPVGSLNIAAWTFILCAPIALVVLASLSVSKELVDAHENRTTVLKTFNTSYTQAMAPRRMARDFILFGELGYYYTYWDVGVQAAELTRPEMFSQLRQQEGIATVLATYTYKINASLTPHVALLTWNISQEVDFEQTHIMFPEILTQGYTDTVADVSKPTSAVMKVMLFTLFSRRYEFLVTTLVQKITGSFEREKKDNAEKISDLESKSVQMASAVLIVSIVVAVGIVFQIVLLFVDFTYAPAKAQGNKGMIASEATKVQLSTISQLSLVLLACVVAGVFTYVVIRLQSSQHTPELLNYASQREYLLTRSLAFVEQQRPENTMFDQRSARINLKRTIVDMRKALNYLYFSSQEVSLKDVLMKKVSAQTSLYVGVNSAQQDSMLWGQGYTVTYSTCPTSQQSTLPYGIATAYLTWIRTLEDYLSITQDTQRQNDIRLSLLKQFYPLLSALQESTYQYEEDELASNTSGFYILIGVALALTLLTVFVVIKPVVRKHRDEEAGTALMIRMIPNEVKESVPIISEFLAATVATTNRKAALDEAAAQMSMMPIVCIDSKGIVLKFNEAAEQMFKYTAAEVVGNNVKLLMPEKFASKHDEYLSRYKQTGIKRITGKEVELTVRLRTGDELTVSLLVKEKVRDNSENLYVGFFKDLTKTKELESAERLNNSLQGLAPVPMIAIDTLGTVMKFNRASEDCFGYQAVDVLGQNVKMLMPEDQAKHHDAYLANYLRTRKKTVIDSARRLYALKKTGEEFLVDLFVKEIRTNDFGSSSMYLGFVKDLTQDIVLEEANVVNDTIANLSPIPIVGIDNTGRVVKFSRAACEVFGYEQSEVLDQKINMLMPADIAAIHDRFLATYEQTKKKTVVDNEVNLTARHKSGRLFPIRSLIKEVSKSGMPSTFVGYLMDCTEEKITTRQKMIDETVADLSPIPLLTITQVGIIISVNKAMCSEFGYRRDEVIDHNVKMLMPEEIAVRHDGILASYNQSRIKRVIGSTRRLHGRRKNGTTFPVEIRVEEVRDEDDVATFVGFLRNLTEDIRLEQQYSVNDIMMNLSPTPIIAITENGTVTAFSHAAVTTFGFSEREVMRQNVKMIMDPKIAEHHDQYLKNYLDTGIKKIIDTTRVLEARRKDGSLFPMEISVREVRKDGQPGSFIAYVRDMSKDQEAAQLVTVNEAMSLLCPIPLIQIDVMGSILRFNEAAQREFGYTFAEVQGRNLKMLMPDEISRFHDGYLSTYKKTRVRNVLGSLRRSKARRKNGYIFAVEIAVEEIQIEGQDQQYIGYVRNVTEELRIMKANEVNEMIADLFPSSLIAITPRGIIIKFNKAACEEFKYTPEQVLGKNIKMLMPDEYAYNHDAYLSAYRKTRVKHVIDQVRMAKGKRSDGTIFPAELSVREISKEGKEPIFMGYVRDCSADAAMMQAMKVAESMQQMGTVPMVMIDTIGTILHVNVATCQIFGYSEDELLGQNVKMIQPTEVALQHDRYLSSYLKTRQRKVIGSRKQHFGRNKQGFLFPIELSVREIKQGDGSTIYISSIRDLTNEQQLLRIQGRNNAILETSIDPCVVISSDGTILSVAESMKNVLGWTSAELIGKNIDVIMPKQIAVKHKGYLDAYMSGQGSGKIIGKSNTLSAVKKSGETVTIELTVQDIMNGSDQCFIGYIRDLSAKYEVELAKKMTDLLVVNSSYPIIVINEVGTVQRFNKAAEDALQYPVSEVLGQNIKMLMPLEIAIKHDQYLATYKATRVRKIIGNKRTVLARRRDGSNYQVEVYVAEIKTEIDGMTSYVGYLRAIEIDLKLQQAEQMNEALLSLSVMPIIGITHNGYVTVFNPKAVETFGYTPQEVIGQKIEMLMQKEIGVVHDSYLERYQRTGVKHVVDTTRRVKAVRKDGSLFAVEISVRENKQMHGPSIFYGFLRDLKEELEKQDVTNMMQALMSISEPIICIRFDGIITHMSDSALQMFGYRPDKVLRKNVKMLMPDDIAEKHDSFLLNYRISRKGSILDRTVQLQAKHQEKYLFPIELRLKEGVFHDKETSMFVGYIRDCRDDTKVQRTQKLAETMGDSSKLALITTDHLGTILRFNKAAETMFGFTRDQVIDRNCRILMPEAMGKRHEAYMQAYQKTGVKKAVDATRTVEAETKNGRVFKVEVTVKEVKQSNGNPSLFVAAMRDPLKKDATSLLQNTMNSLRKLRVGATPSTTSSLPDGVMKDTISK